MIVESGVIIKDVGIIMTKPHAMVILDVSGKPVQVCHVTGKINGMLARATTYLQYGGVVH